MIMISDLGSRIKDRRKKMGYSQTELGSLVNVTSSAISAYELSERVPSIGILAKIAKVLGTSIDYLAFGETNTATQLNLDGLKPADADAIRTLVNSLKTK